ncbi:MAG: dihydroneopterin aldolase [Cyclobacteriaceae bacterium]|jgi:dihydroneopterin aldolase|nr:MAG: dihydroneopterin aldolase [Cyclobacteriaceae bacterium]
MTGRVALEGLEFHAFHGVYPHERESGNWFEVDIAVETDFSAAAFEDDLSGTVNYETLFAIVKEEMDKPSKLLETVAGKIIDDILQELPVVHSVDIKISKVNPPIGGKCKRATVQVFKKR